MTAVGANAPVRVRRQSVEFSKKKRLFFFLTWTVGYGVKVAVGEHEMLRSALRLQPDRNIGDTVIEAGEASQEVDGEGPGGALDIHSQLMGPRCRLDLNVLYLLQQVAHCQDFILLAAHGPGPHAGDPLQMSPGL